MQRYDKERFCGKREGWIWYLGHHFSPTCCIITGLFISLKVRCKNVSEKEPISADEGATKRGASGLNNNQSAIHTTLNTKTTNNKEKIHEFNFKAAKNKEFFTSNSKCHLNKKHFR
jgi:hypothetical protein